jgi:hypothetical protein
VAWYGWQGRKQVSETQISQISQIKAQIEVNLFCALIGEICEICVSKLLPSHRPFRPPIDGLLPPHASFFAAASGSMTTISGGPTN